MALTCDLCGRGFRTPEDVVRVDGDSLCGDASSGVARSTAHTAERQSSTIDPRQQCQQRLKSAPSTHAHPIPSSPSSAPTAPSSASSSAVPIAPRVPFAYTPSEAAALATMLAHRTKPTLPQRPPSTTASATSGSSGAARGGAITVAKAAPPRAPSVALAMATLPYPQHAPAAYRPPSLGTHHDPWTDPAIPTNADEAEPYEGLGGPRSPASLLRGASSRPGTTRQGLSSPSTTTRTRDRPPSPAPTPAPAAAPGAEQQGAGQRGAGQQGPREVLAHGYLLSRSAALQLARW